MFVATPHFKGDIMKPNIPINPKELKFIENYVMSGNAKQSAIDSGYAEQSSAQMGYYLKSKYRDEITRRQVEDLQSLSAKSITTLQNLLDSGSDSVKFHTSKLILELSGYSPKNNMAVKFDDTEYKTEELLLDELKDLLKEHPELIPKEYKK